MRVGLERKLNTKELMLLNCGVGEDSWESLGLQGDPTSPAERKSILNIHWKDWCWSWNSITLATRWDELTHWKRSWCWERVKAGGEGDDRGWDGWMASPAQWTWVSLSKFWELVIAREAWHTAVHEVGKSGTWLRDWTDVCSWLDSDYAFLTRMPQKWISGVLVFTVVVGCFVFVSACAGSSLWYTYGLRLKPLFPALEGCFFFFFFY